MAEARKTTMGHITTDHLRQSKIVLPSTRIVREFQEKVESLFEMKIKNNEESKELASLRDFLLPMLMNGQVGFKE
jgi:type I restriction enzyme S subunit